MVKANPEKGFNFPYLLKTSKKTSDAKYFIVESNNTGNGKSIKVKYIKMLKQRYISCLVNLNKDQISNGIKEIKKLFSKKINFIDKLISIRYIKKS